MLNASQIVITSGEMKDMFFSSPQNCAYATFQQSGQISALNTDFSVVINVSQWTILRTVRSAARMVLLHSPGITSNFTLSEFTRSSKNIHHA